MTINGIRAWPSEAKLWPTYVALGVSATSLILATMVLFAYCCGTKAANKVNLARTVLTVGMLIFTAALWALAAAGLQGTSAFDGVGSQSLWSATCDSTDQQHELFGHWINFSQICLEQVCPPLFTFVLFVSNCRNGDWCVLELELDWKV